jgi:hypothetical protein
MTQQDKGREDEWNRHKLECLARYVSSLSRADQIAWAEKQSEQTKERVKNEIIKLKSRAT